LGFPVRIKKQSEGRARGGAGSGTRVLTFEDKGTEVQQAPGHLGQGGLQQPGILVGAQPQELHLQQLLGLLGTQVQQPVAAPGV
jgi:hypothetical protein